MVHSSPIDSRLLPVTENAVALPPPEANIMAHIQRPPCPNCQTTTMLARVTPGPSGVYIRTFECRACDLVHQVVASSDDPMKSGKMDGWLMGGLQTPT